MDYDRSTIPTVYDAARNLSSEGLNLWLDLVSRDADPVAGCLIVDLGCGTGRFSEPLANRFMARVIGIDPSLKMLEVARRKLQTDRVEFKNAPAHSLPVAEGSVDIVFMSMVFIILMTPERFPGNANVLFSHGWTDLHPQHHTRSRLRVSSFLSGDPSHDQNDATDAS